MNSRKSNKYSTSNSSLFSKTNLSNDLQQLYLTIFMAFALYMSVFRNGFYFKWAESLSIFINSEYFFHDCMRFAGGLLTYAGAFFTQFYYFPVIGSIIFIAMLLFIRYLSVIAFDIPIKYRPLAYVPALILLLSVTQLGYVWLTLKSPGYFFSNTLGIIVCLLVFRGYRLLAVLGWRIVIAVFFSLVGYPLFGFYALLAIALFAIYELLLFFANRNYLHFLPVVSGTALVIVVPQIYYNYVYSYMQYVQIYTAGLPRFNFDSKEFILWIPFILLFVTLFLFLGFAVRKKDKSLKNQKSHIPLLVFCFSMVFVYIFSFSDDNFKTEIKMASAMERNNFREVAYYADQVKGVPTRNIVLNNNLARLAIGMPENRALNISNTVKPNCVRPSMPIILHMSGRPLFYLTGQINDCYHWCMEDMVEYGMKSSYLKYMVKSAIVNREYELARKYNTVLSETLFYRKWAKKYQAYIDDPSLTENDSEIKAIRSNSEQGISSDL
ncbi:MAG TPA: DUF6057 family protein [Bacteroidales bacterium]|nr:DUF6057 family protein [Bacteroidales bacterium]